jgi:hypothetical protein
MGNFSESQKIKHKNETIIFMIALLCALATASQANHVNLPDLHLENVTTEEKLTGFEKVSASEVANLDLQLLQECCDSYVTDATTGESFVVVTVCLPGNGDESHILACVQADAIRDAVLALIPPQP